ncbi:unnamed protein product [Durusdinium trenchii]|uniref:Core Histone H2A/H2B/H3 domain-containing protein n=1 Tax=Durusdinium trenchii TaxID=1381693 RepID=A0ABP0S6E8_9DINO
MAAKSAAEPLVAPCSMLVSSLWLPIALRDNVTVRLCVGHFLFHKPSLPAVDPASLSPSPVKKRGRPQKDEVREKKQPKGQYGTRQLRSAEDEIRHLQSAVHMTCLPKAPFQRLVKDILKGFLDTRNSESGPGGEHPLPNLRISSSAIQLLQDAAEALGTEYMVKGSMAAAHAKRQTVTKQDLMLVRQLSEYSQGTSLPLMPGRKRLRKSA